MTDSAIPGDPRPAWDVIEDSCASRFTGELSLRTVSATTNVYMTRGLIYFAERVGNRPLGERVAEAGLIPADVLPAGGAPTDLHGLFANHPESARARVEAAIQDETEDLLVRIAADEVVSSESTMYRHHPSGIDRWFSSHRARAGEAPVSGAPDITAAEPAAQTVVTDSETVDPASPPDVVAPMVGENTPADVTEAVQRAVSAIESATTTVGHAPKGFVRAPRTSDPQP